MNPQPLRIFNHQELQTISDGVPEALMALRQVVHRYEMLLTAVKQHLPDLATPSDIRAASIAKAALDASIPQAQPETFFDYQGKSYKVVEYRGDFNEKSQCQSCALYKTPACAAFNCGGCIAVTFGV